MRKRNFNEQRADVVETCCERAKIEEEILILCVCSLRFTDVPDQLVIKPGGDSHVKDKGSNFALTCELNVPQKNLISNLRWLDPRNQVIDERYL